MQPVQSSNSSTETTWEPEIVPISSIASSPLHWIWPGRIPLYKLTILSGDPNLGKSFLTMDIAARVSTGSEWPDGEQACDAGRVLLLSAEDDATDTIRPRLEAAGADLDRVEILERMRCSTEKNSSSAAGMSTRPVSLYEDVALIGRVLRRRTDYRLVVIDPISAYLENLLLNSNNDVRALLFRLAELAEECEVAVLLVSHLRKSPGHTPAVYRTIGSVAFTAVSRALWTVVKDPGEEGRRLVVPVKMNLVRDPLGMAFRIVDPGRVEWEPEPLLLDADDRGENAYSDLDRTDRQKQATYWLHTLLSNGPLPSNEIKKLARETGIGKPSLWEAKKELKARAVKEKKTGTWLWELPWEMQVLPPEDWTGSIVEDLKTADLIRVAKSMGLPRGGMS